MTLLRRFSVWAAARRAQREMDQLALYGVEHPPRLDPNLQCRCGQRFPSYNGADGIWHHQLTCPAGR